MTTYQETYLYFYSLSCFIIEAVTRNHIKHVQIVNNVKVGSKLLTGSTEIPEHYALTISDVFSLRDDFQQSSAFRQVISGQAKLKTWLHFCISTGVI